MNAMPASSPMPLFDRLCGKLLAMADDESPDSGGLQHSLRQDLANSIRDARIKRRALPLQRLHVLSELFTRAGMIGARFGRCFLQGVEHARDAECGEFAGEDGL